MTKVRKVKRRKKFRVNVNRKRLRNKLKRLPTITCPQVKDAWQVTASTRVNLHNMGLAYDANKALAIPNTKKKFLNEAKRKTTVDEVSSEEDENMQVAEPPKCYVAQELEDEAKAPRRRMFRLPNGQVEFITYMMDKYGEDYKAMAQDKKNYNQLTWKQIRAKIKQFMGIPEQYNAYLTNKQIE